MSASKLDLSDRADLVRLARIVGAVQECTTAEFLLVGAAARDLVMHHHHGIALQRATYDVDLAVAVPNWKAFDDLRRELQTRAGFEVVEGVEHRLRHPALGDVDLVPFGGVEVPDGSLPWPPDGDPVLNVLGFREAISTARIAALPTGVEARVLAVPLMALLKVLAWEDRGRRVPRKDASDLFFLIRNYEQAGNSERIYDETSEVLGTYDFEELSAWLLGRDAREFLRSCPGSRPQFLATVRAVISRECDPEGTLRLVGDAEGATAERRLQLLCAFRAGLDE